jgi:hypothetical protein
LILQLVPIIIVLLNNKGMIKMAIPEDKIQVPSIIPKTINTLLLEDATNENNSRSAIICRIVTNYYKSIGRYPIADNK